MWIRVQVPVWKDILFRCCYYWNGKRRVANFSGQDANEFWPDLIKFDPRRANYKTTNFYNGYYVSTYVQSFILGSPNFSKSINFSVKKMYEFQTGHLRWASQLSFTYVICMYIHKIFLNLVIKSTPKNMSKEKLEHK